LSLAENGFLSLTRQPPISMRRTSSHYKVNDGTSDGNTITVSITIGLCQRLCRSRTADAYQTGEDTPLIVAAGRRRAQK